MKRVLPLSLLLCFLVCTAALDSIPDPAAIEQNWASAIRTVAPGQAEPVTEYLTSSVVLSQPFAVPSPAGRHVNGWALNALALVRHAGNSSPPQILSVIRHERAVFFGSMHTATT